MRSFWKLYRRNRSAVAGLVILTLVVALAATAHWFFPDDPLINGMTFGVGARPGKITGIKNLIPDLESADIAADFPNNSGGIITNDFRALVRSQSCANLHIHRIDRNASDLNQKIVGPEYRFGSVKLNQ